MSLILIADDDELLVELVRSALRDLGYVVGSLDDGTNVCEVVKLKRPALVILDCSMPGLPGVEALRQIRRSFDCFSTPVLMLTGRSSAADEQIAMQAGANDYMRKPFDMDELLFRIELLLAEAQARSTPDLPKAFGTG